MFLSLRAGDLAARISPMGGALVDASFRDTGFVRSYEGSAAAPFDVLKTASFPLVPFGNRIEGNGFEFAGSHYHFAPNWTQDRHVIHGDGWQLPWQVTAQQGDAVTLFLVHAASDKTPFCYESVLSYALRDGALRVEMSVTNRGGQPMPFGLGHHPYFPLTPQTQLQASARHYWSERPGYLPDKKLDLPPDLDFATAQPLPDRWIDNGFDGWDGRARILWPERALGVTIEVDAPFTRYHLYRPDHTPGPGASERYFCFEPMTHCANAHNMPGGEGLVRLEPGQSLHSLMTIRPFVP